MIAALLAIILAASSNNLTYERDLMRETWGIDRLREALGPNARIRNVHISPRASVQPHVCGLVSLPDPYWGYDLYKAFFVNGTTGSISIDNNTLQFTNLWQFYCGSK